MLISAEHLSINFGSRQLLDDVDFYLNEGDKTGVIGINGTGKSSFLRVLAGQQVPDSGTVSRDPNVQVCFLSQNPKMDPEATVLEQVFSDFSPDTRALMEYEAKAMLTRLGITDFAQPVGTLSGGQRKRVALAAVLLHPADVLILDEPTNHLDSDMVIWLEDRLRKFNGGLIMVTHDRYFLERVANRITELSHCHIRHYEANYSKYLELKTQQEEMERYTAHAQEGLFDYIYEHLPEFELLLRRAAGTEYAHYIDELVEIEVSYTYKYMEVIGCESVRSGQVTEDLIHIVTTAYFNGMFEPVRHRMDKARALHYIRQLNRYHMAGFETIFHPENFR